jgi:hypothetical protein
VIDRCRNCHASPLGLVLDLGRQHLSDFADTPDYRPPAHPLQLVRCHNCGLGQLGETVPREELYHDRYGFYSGVNETIRADLADVAATARRYVPHPLAWLDIASNDGTLLSFVPPEVFRVGVDPVVKFQPLAAQHADFAIPAYFGAHLFGLTRFDVITSVSMFYDLDDPNAFVDEVRRVLHPDGVWVIQQNDLGTMLDQGAVDNVCLPPEDPVLTDQGLKPIGEIQPGDRVLTHKGNYQEVTEVLRRPYDGPLLEIRAYGFGHTLRVTPGHPVLTPNWFARASDLRVGDVVGRAIPQPEDKPPEDHLFDRSLAAVCGYYLAEGTIAVHGTAVRFCFGKGEEERKLADRCRRLIGDLGIRTSLHEVRTGIVVQAYGWLPAFLVEHFGKGSANKRIPAWVMDSETAEELLRCYMAGDGYHYRNGYLRSSTVSHQLAIDLQLLANRIGWKASISRQNRPPTCVIEGRTVNQRPLWDILVYVEPRRRQKVWVERGAQWGRIRQITERHYVGEVVNLEVAGDRSYSTPAMTVQNCHEHITYWSVAALVGLLERHGLEILEVSWQPVNGGCHRVVVGHAGIRPVDETVGSWLAGEVRYQLDGPWEAFADRARRLSLSLRALAEDAAYAEQPLDIYGASTRGAVLWQYADLDRSLVRQAVERNPDKVGRYYSAVDGLPIVSEEQMRADPPDLLLLGPYWLLDGTLARERAFLEQGGRLVVPLPKLRVISKEDLL